MGRPGQAPTHWLRANEREWTPGHCIFIDTETRTVDQDDRETLKLRCWAGRSVDRRNLRKTSEHVREGFGYTRATLAAWVSQMTIGRKSSWLFAHNLGFDLTVADLIGQLAALGWALSGEWSSNDRALWFRMAREGRTLALADSVTYLPAKLADVALKVGKAKLPDPAPSDEDGWAARCRGDVDIMATALLTLMDWWDREKLGNWTVTGNGCGWNAMRHMAPKRTILVKVGDGGRELERQAIYGGRRDATRWGEVPGGPFVTLDFEDAYPTLAAHLRLPNKRMGRFDRLSLDSPDIGDTAVQILARVTVQCSEPRYPLRYGGAVWYPVGRFKTVLAGPDILEARDRGELVSIGEGFRYWCDGHLAGWARWVIDLAHGRIDSVPPVATIPAKRWGRSVIGRFGQRIGTTEHYGPAQSSGWASEPLSWPAEGVHGRIVDLAGERWLVKQDQEADDSFPAVLAWVEAYTRVRLNRMLDQIPEGDWVSCNTDGALVDFNRGSVGASAGPERRYGLDAAVRAASRLCDQIAPSTWPLVPRPKDAHSHVWLAGPATLELDGRRAMSGIASSASPGADGKLSAHVWPGLAWQMEHGDRSGFVRPMVSYSVPSVTVHRWALADGSTAPLKAATLPDGSSILHALATYPGSPGPANLAPEQSRAVARLLV